MRQRADPTARQTSPQLRRRERKRKTGLFMAEPLFSVEAGVKFWWYLLLICWPGSAVRLRDVDVTLRASAVAAATTPSGTPDWT